MWPRRRRWPVSSNTPVTVHDAACHRCLICTACYGGWRYRCGLVLCLQCDALVSQRENTGMGALLEQHPELAELRQMAARILKFYE